MQRPFVTESNHRSKSVNTGTGSKALPVTSECAGLSAFGRDSKSTPWKVCRLEKSTAPNSVSSPLPGQGPVASQSTKIRFFMAFCTSEAPGLRPHRARTDSGSSPSPHYHALRKSCHSDEAGISCCLRRELRRDPSFLGMTLVGAAALASLFLFQHADLQ